MMPGEKKKLTIIMENLHDVIDLIHGLIQKSDSFETDKAGVKDASQKDTISLSDETRSLMTYEFTRLDMQMKLLKLTSGLVNGFSIFIDQIIVDFESIQADFMKNSLTRSNVNDKLINIFSNIVKLEEIDRKTKFVTEETKIIKDIIKSVYKEMMGVDFSTTNAESAARTENKTARSDQPQAKKANARSIKITSDMILEMQKPIENIKKCIAYLKIIDSMLDFEKSITVITKIVEKIETFSVDSEVEENEITSNLQIAQEEFSTMMSDLSEPESHFEAQKSDLERSFSNAKIQANILFKALKGYDLPARKYDSAVILEVQPLMKNILEFLKDKTNEPRARIGKAVEQNFSEFQTLFRKHFNGNNLSEITKTYAESFYSLSAKHDDTIIKCFKESLSAMVGTFFIESFKSKDTDSVNFKKISPLISAIIDKYRINGRESEERGILYFKQLRSSFSSLYSDLKKNLSPSPFTLEEFETRFKVLLSNNTSWNFCRYLMRDTMKYEAIEA